MRPGTPGRSHDGDGNPQRAHGQNSITIFSMSNAFSRRAFFGTVTGLAALAPLGAQEKVPSWDLSWLDRFKGKHKQTFDLGSAELGEDSPLRLPNNYLNTLRDVLHSEGADVNVAVGIART